MGVVKLVMPDALQVQLKAEATAERRSLPAHIVWLLEHSMTRTGSDSTRQSVPQSAPVVPQPVHKPDVKPARTSMFGGFVRPAVPDTGPGEPDPNDGDTD